MVDLCWHFAYCAQRAAAIEWYQQIRYANKSRMELYNEYVYDHTMAMFEFYIGAIHWHEILSLY